LSGYLLIPVKVTRKKDNGSLLFKSKILPLFGTAQNIHFRSLFLQRTTISVQIQEIEEGCRFHKSVVFHSESFPASPSECQSSALIEGLKHKKKYFNSQQFLLKGQIYLNLFDKRS